MDWFNFERSLAGDDQGVWPPSQVLQFNVYRKNSFASIEAISQEVKCLVFVTLALLGERREKRRGLDEMIALTSQSSSPPHVRSEIRYLQNVISIMWAPQTILTVSAERCNPSNIWIINLIRHFYPTWVESCVNMFPADNEGIADTSVLF